MNDVSESFAWAARQQIYAFIVETGRPPTVAEAAAVMHAREATMRDAYRWLHDHHALFLEPGRTCIRMAHPFSGVPTPFRVLVDGRAYWANCAWDALGIPAALHAGARIEAETGDDGAPVRLAVEASALTGWEGVVHFALPFRHWYDDLVLT